MGLLDLPVELIFLIADFLEFDDALSLATCCRDVRFLVFPSLCRVWFVHLWPESLDLHRFVAQQPSLAQACRELHFFAFRSEPLPRAVWDLERARPWDFYKHRGTRGTVGAIADKKRSAADAIRKVLVSADLHLKCGDADQQAALLINTLEQYYDRYCATGRLTEVHTQPARAIDEDNAWAEQHLLPDFAKLTLDALYTRYTRHTEDERALINGSTIQDTFEVIFRRCLGIEVLGYRNDDSRSTAYQGGLVWLGTDDRRRSVEGLPHLAQMILAAARANISPKVLRLEYVEHTFLFIVRSKDPLAWTKVLRNVEVLEWTIRHGDEICTK